MVLDEADQMLNVGFEKDVETILENVPQASCSGSIVASGCGRLCSSGLLAGPILLCPSQ